MTEEELYSLILGDVDQQQLDNESEDDFTELLAAATTPNQDSLLHAVSKSIDPDEILFNTKQTLKIIESEDK